MTRKNKNSYKRIFGYSFIMTLVALLTIFTVKTSAYNCKPGDTECEAAKANMQQNQAAANEFSNKADSVAGVIDQLNSEIGSLNGEIAASENKIKELKVQITETEQKLSETQAALAEMLVNMHFSGDSEPITILAGSKSISDYAEKQAREDVAKQEITAASERVKTMREELQAKKDEAEQTLESLEGKRTLVASKRETQKSLMAEYEKNADEASALASYWEEQLKALAWTPPSNSVGNGSRSWGANNTYPYRYNCPQDNVRYSAYGGAVCQCTSYASYKAQERWGIVNTWGGHAYNYVNAVGYTVPSTGIRTYVDKNPAPNTIAIQLGGSYGHVMWVESVNANGSINVTEYNVNWPSIGCYLGDFCSRNNVGSAGTWFLHFD
ncbi:MAG: CHAP domain-containing protein [Candidatus Saccharibacteria bacterium]|nr:CHAP domain-containing protein [Candidatus Saccharibacteria bacterium]